MMQIFNIFLQTASFEDILLNLENLGFFTFILPFLLMFAIVYGVLSWTNIFGGQKGVHALIALVFAFLSIRFPVYTDFLAIVSPKLGVGLVILLVLILLIGLFIPGGKQSVIGWIMIGIGVIIAIVILSQTYSTLQGSYGGYIDSDLIGWVIVVALLIGVIVAVVTAGNKSSGNSNTGLERMWQKLTS